MPPSPTKCALSLALLFTASCEQVEWKLGEQPAFDIAPTTELPAQPELLALGQRTYALQCSPCHGQNGAGDGPAAYLLYPKPRNFRRATYRFGSTWGATPTDRDLYVAISRGIPGSAMPSWSSLPEPERWGLVHYVKSLAEEALPVVGTETEDHAEDEAIVKLPPEPPYDAAAQQEARKIFVKTCVQCHGERGRGDGPSALTLRDDEKTPIRPRDLTTGVFKGARAPEDIYRRILRGIPGTPMPATPQLYGDKAWHLVHFVLSMSSERLRDRAEMKRYRIPVVRVEELPDHPDAGAWRQGPATELHMMPLWWRYNRPEYVTVRAVHDGKSIALLLVWEDDSLDDLVVRPQDFRDAAAVELTPATDDPPFFAMGERGRSVNVWMWKSDRQADLIGFQDLEAQYPNIGIDSYPNLQAAPYEQPMRHALTLQSDPTFITAWGAGNIVADPIRRSAGEDLRAQGFGTLRAASQQEMESLGVYSHGSYRVMFRRRLDGKAVDAVTLAPGGAALVGFAVWNGSARDRDGQKSVTIWQELVLEP